VDSLPQRQRMVDGAPRLQPGHGLRLDPLRRHEAESVGSEPPQQGPSARVVLIAAVAQRDPGAFVDEYCAEGAHRRRRDRRGAPYR